jgi:hypothetical protein
VLKGVGRVELPKEAVFERTTLTFTRGVRPKSAGELTAVGVSARVLPASTPLRAAVDVSLALPGPAPSHVGLYLGSGDGWEFVGDDVDKVKHTVSGATRHFGRFALFRDLRAPAIKPPVAPRTAPAGPYSRWALESTLADHGSGIDLRATYFVVDGRRVPSEWDSVVQILRWKPLRMPASGLHHVTVVAADHAGNIRKASGTFVVG